MVISTEWLKWDENTKTLSSDMYGDDGVFKKSGNGNWVNDVYVKSHVTGRIVHFENYSVIGSDRAPRHPGWTWTANVDGQTITLYLRNNWQ